MDLTSAQIQRYTRNIMLEDIGAEGQIKISEGKVLIVGAGGLGSPAALYLAAAGVGTIGLIDGDVVDISNLQRQIIHFTTDVNKTKVQSAKEKINQLNPEVNVVIYHDLLTAGNIMDIISNYDIILDGTDNFSTKFLINDACVLAGKPFCHGGIVRFEGQAFTYLPGSACYRCFFHAPPQADIFPTCLQAGVLGSVTGMLGSIQATEVLKFLTGIGELLIGRLLSFDAMTMNFRTISVKHDPHCPVCGDNPSVTSIQSYGTPACAINPFL